MHRPAAAAPLLPLLALLASLAAQAPPPTRQPLCGRVETHQGLRLLRVWGSDEQRGYAHGFLLGPDIAAMLRNEFAARFQRKRPMLEQVRRMLPRLIAWPAAQQAELTALFQGVKDSGASLAMPELERDFDLEDLKVANALDVFGLLGCSGFTVWGDQVEGGGVLTGRNFDWPFTGEHMLDATMLVVEHLPAGRAIASVAWPGYLGTVTGVNSDGVAAFLHVGNAKVTMLPEPESWPTATAAREILVQLGAASADPFGTAQELLGHTSPPAGFVTRVVLPAPWQGTPAGVFEADSKKVARAKCDGPVVVTNHFQGRNDGRKPSVDSTDRADRLRHGIDAWLAEGDKKVSVAEAWQLLQAVERGGGHLFGTLHSLVFRPDPWCFELRIATWQKGNGITPATRSQRHWELPRTVLFAADVPPAK